MDGLGVAASIVSIATVGVQVSIKLVTLATQISTASDRVSSIGNDIALTSGVLHQLGELMSQNTTDDGISILNQHGIETTKTSAAMCKEIFQKIEMELTRASEQLRKCKPSRGRMSGEKIELSMKEKAKWPFLQPKIDSLSTDLRDAKSTLMLMLQLASLALSKRVADASMSSSENQDLVRAIVAWELQRREEHTNASSSNNTHNAGNAKTRSLGEDSSDSNARESQHFVNLTVAPPAGSKLPQKDKISTAPENCANDSSHKAILFDDDSKTETNYNVELHLFLLKPTVKDLVNKIELRWSLQNTNMRHSAIREHMAKNKKSDLPSVLEMLRQLHTYEQAVVDSEMSKDSGWSILSLERTKTDIHCRDMLFKAVPGLQFVVERQPVPRRLQCEISSRPSLYDDSQTPGFRPLPSLPHHKNSKSRRNRLASVLTILKKSKVEEKGDSKPSPLQSTPSLLHSPFDDLPVPRRKPEMGRFNQDSILRSRESRIASCQDSIAHPVLLPTCASSSSMAFEYALPGGERSGFMTLEADVDEQYQEDEEAEAMVTDLLGKYTTLSNL